MTDEEREECELMRGRLMLIVRTLEAVKDFPDDGSSNYAMDTIIREDVPAVLGIIDRQQAELLALRNVAEQAEDYIRCSLIPTRDGRLAASLSAWKEAAKNGRTIMRHANR